MSGLATVPKPVNGRWVPDFVASRWIAENLCRAAEGRGLDEMLDEFACRASSEVARVRDRVPPRQRALTVILGGFAQDGDGNGRAVLRVVSNFQTLNTDTDGGSGRTSGCRASMYPQELLR
jgi:hypothetical protein